MAEVAQQYARMQYANEQNYTVPNLPYLPEPPVGSEQRYSHEAAEKGIYLIPYARIS
jgi:hypothetical protein